MDYDHYEVCVREFRQELDCYETIESPKAYDGNEDGLELACEDAIAITEANRELPYLVSVIGITEDNCEEPIVDYFWDKEHGFVGCEDF